MLRHLTVEQNLVVGGHMERSGQAVRRRLDDVYSRIPRLRELRDRTTGYLSGGEQQMVVIGRALMAAPKLIMIDEPSLGLAPMIVREIFHIIVELKKRGASILLVEQNARAALKVADHAYVLETGEIALQGPAAQLANDQRVIDSYLGLGGRQ